MILTYRYRVKGKSAERLLNRQAWILISFGISATRHKKPLGVIINGGLQAST
jgi:hypothetical protein